MPIYNHHSFLNLNLVSLNRNQYEKGVYPKWQQQPGSRKQKLHQINLRRLISFLVPTKISVAIFRKGRLSRAMKVNEEKRANAKIMPYFQRSVNFEISFLFLQFSQKTKKKIRLYYHGTSSRIVFVYFLGELKTPKR